MKKSFTFLIVLSLLLLTVIGCDRQHKHTAIIDAALPATCTSTGLTEGSHCSECGEVIAEQQTVPAVGHDYEETLTFDDYGTAVHSLQSCKNCGDEKEKRFSAGLDYEPDKENMTCAIIGMGACKDTEINIPPVISGYEVTGIDNYAFGTWDSITSVDIPEGVTHIGFGAFWDCYGLDSIWIPNSLQLIEYQAFTGCGLKNLYINDLDAWMNVCFEGGGSHPLSNSGEGILYIDGEAVTDLVIPNTISQISESAFLNCTNISSVSIPDSVTSIGGGAFSGCSSLTSIKMPNGVDEIGGSLFYGCTSLERIDLPEGITVIGAFAFSGCKALGSIRIPDGVTSIGHNAFANCRNLKSIELPSSITKIFDNAFDEYTSIDDVNYTGELADWCNIHFGDAEANPLHSGGNLYINNVLIEDAVVGDTDSHIIGYYAFYGCKSLKTVSIPDSVWVIGAFAFENCENLVSVKIGEGISAIGGGTFANCVNLRSVTLPAGLSSVIAFAFENCEAIDDVYFTGDIADWCKISFDPTSNPLEYGANLYINGVKLENAEIEVSKVFSFVFEYAFCGCESLKTVVIPDGTTAIEKYSFNDCINLESVTIPVSMQKIDWYAFFGCESLKTVFYKGTAEDWNKIQILNAGPKLTSATRYYYSETKPEQEGNYWRYVDGKPTAW